jgi:hypothetical protein
MAKSKYEQEAWDCLNEEQYEIISKWYYEIKKQHYEEIANKQKEERERCKQAALTPAFAVIAWASLAVELSTVAFIFNLVCAAFSIYYGTMLIYESTLDRDVFQSRIYTALFGVLVACVFRGVI